MESAVQQLIDRVEIEHQLYHYSRHADLNMPERMVEVFTEDCRSNYHRGDADWLEGRVELRELLQRSLSLYVATNHTVTNLELTFQDADHATSHSYVQAWHRYPDDRADFLALGRYDDVWLRTPAGWRIAVRRFSVAAAVGRSVENNEPIGRREVTPPVV